MKHVFIAHSHTLLLTSLGVVDYMGLKKDVVYVCTRGFYANYFPDSAKVVDANEMFEKINAVAWSDWAATRKVIQTIDAMIEEWIGEEYELYVPHLANPFFLLLYHHPLCRKVSYVQEGAFTMQGMFVYDVSLIYQLRRRFCLFRRFGNQRLYGAGFWYYRGVLDRQKHVDAYALYPEYFKYLKCRLHRVSWPDIDIKLQSDITGPVFIFDGFVKNDIAEKKYYLQQCNDMISRFHGDVNFLKFHPAQSSEERTMICEMFGSRKLKYCVMTDNVPFELYIIKKKNMTVIGMGSSLLYFAHERGHHVVCCDTWMLGDVKYQRVHEMGNPLFHKYFKDASEVKKL